MWQLCFPSFFSLFCSPSPDLAKSAREATPRHKEKGEDRREEEEEEKEKRRKERGRRKAFVESLSLDPRLGLGRVTIESPMA